MGLLGLGHRAPQMAAVGQVEGGHHAVGVHGVHCGAGHQRLGGEARAVVRRLRRCWCSRPLSGRRPGCRRRGRRVPPYCSQSALVTAGGRITGSTESICRPRTLASTGSRLPGTGFFSSSVSQSNQLQADRAGSSKGSNRAERRDRPAGGVRGGGRGHSRSSMRCRTRVRGRRAWVRASSRRPGRVPGRPAARWSAGRRPCCVCPPARCGPRPGAA